MDQDITTLGDHVTIMRRRWRLLVVFTLLGILTALALSSLQEPLYRSEATLLLEPETVSTSAVVMDPDEVATQARVVASLPVAQRVVEALSLAEDPDTLLDTVTVEVKEQTRTVGITAERSTAEEAAAVANAVASEYVDYRTGAALEASTAARDQLLAQLAEVRGELVAVRDELQSLVATDERRQELEAREQSLLAVETQVSTDLALTAASAPQGDVGGQLLRGAEPPDAATQPRPVRAAGFGALLGLVLGVLLAYVRDRFDDGIRDELRLRAAVDGQPVLGRIPRALRPDRSRLVTLVAPHSPESEGYRTLATNIRFLSSGHADRSMANQSLADPSLADPSLGELLVVTSADPGEGKTTVAANVAVTAARVGLRVILVEADLRNPGLADHFGIELPLGLSHVLADQADLEKVIFDAEDIDVPELGILGAGTVPPNPAELLAGPQAGAVWRELRTMADLVVVDTAPVLRVADTLEIVGAADLTVLVARYRRSRAHRVVTAVERIRQVGGSVAGVAWCALPSGEDAYGYGVLSE
jgi:capsular exopolysaccharide synthesis family protein